jgi:uncharacterized membrane protein (UPF0182 family)
MRSRSGITIALIALLLFVALPSLANLYTEWLWFGEVGYQSIFLKSLTTKGLIGSVGFLIAFVVLYANLRFAIKEIHRPYVLFAGGGDLQPLVLERSHVGVLAIGVSALVALFVGSVASSQWMLVLRYFEATPFGEVDPLFGLDASFYIFALPFYDFLRFSALSLIVLALSGSVGAYVIASEIALDPSGIQIGKRARQHLLLLIAGIFGLLAWGAYLEMPRLLTTPAGILDGASYVDIVVRLPAFRILIAVSVLAGGAAAYAAFSRTTWPVAVGIAGYLLVWIGGGGAATAFQQLVVTPDEQRLEAPYITHNIEATRRAFDIDIVEERQVSGDALLTREDIANNAETINNVRLWDHQPLLDTFGQIQEIRTYYEFASVDNDRYVVDGEYRQTMVSTRELNSENLPNQSWINEHLQYTHGFGVALGPVNQVTQEGLPVLFIQDLPPTSRTDLSVDQPSIYFGELSNNYVVVNTNTDEFHYPEGDDNVSTRYDGNGGLELGGMFRRLLFSLRFQSYEILVSGQLNSDSRIIFHRNISDRVATIAPFLRYDADPYLVIADGRLYWMRDAYTATGDYPYSTPAGNGINYIRNSVKIVIDAYNGDTTFYLAEPDDPLGVTLGKIFPGFLQPLDSMPESLRSHIRYPEGIFALQSAMYSTFHMTNPAVFYNREDDWEVPIIDNEQMEPYYTIMRLPGEERAEFIQMLPFTPRGRNNLAAWFIARSDGDNYGKMQVFQFPKQKLVFGPSQIVARINQDEEISPQITLWNQQGSEVIQGTLLVIPIEEALLYIRPLYLRSSGGRIPELRRVVVAYQNQIVMEETLDLALERLFGSDSTSPPSIVPANLVAETLDPADSVDSLAVATQQSSSSSDLAGQAQDHYSRALEAQRQGNWSQYGEEIERLGEVLDELRESDSSQN